jgi:sulfite exporter TauE/SafE
MNTVLSTVTASLLGSLHCVGMCGGLISFYAASEGAAPSSRWSPHIAYHGTRLIAYASLGALAGGLGSALDRVGSLFGFGELGVLIAASAVLLWGVPLLLGRHAPERLLRLGRKPARRSPVLARLEREFVGLAARIRRQPPLWRAGALGLSSALLPCGWLYAFVLLAAAAGSPARGALLMAAFWSGTVPALLGLGVGVARLGRSVRARLPRISAALVIGVCAFNVVSRWPVASAREPGDAQTLTVPSCHAH